ncbi:hypothetical protein KDA_25600 [Dictyobacter alpinus]|uniref:Uncharacterized protein n=1 Tax=Dictyobacter alpinus TaxID=2014873 RepID=A0A402B6W1_9CHLR|nr:hypothetical protein KDA_25600 [Dictyobacter alpinus]
MGVMYLDLLVEVFFVVSLRLPVNSAVAQQTSGNHTTYINGCVSGLSLYVLAQPVRRPAVPQVRGMASS